MDRSYVPEATQDETAADAPRPEAWYRDLLASQLGGQIEAELLFGRADLLTDENVFEVEPALHWRTGVRQALAYAAQAGIRGALAVYGKPTLALVVLRHLQKLPPPGIDLWWFTGEAFARIASEEDAAGIPATAVVPDGPVLGRGPQSPAEEVLAWGTGWHVIIKATTGPGLSLESLDCILGKSKGTMSCYIEPSGARVRFTGPAKGATAAEAVASASAYLVRAFWVKAGAVLEVTDARALRWENFVAETYPDGLPEWLAGMIGRDEAKNQAGE